MASNNQTIYELNGEKLTTHQLRQKIIDLIGDGKMTIREMEAAFGFKEKKLVPIITGMASSHIILMEKLQNNKRFSVYYNHPKSMLQNIFHPLPKSFDTMKGQVYTERHAKHNNTMRTPYETFNFSSMYSCSE
jgi:hypothetical protein